MSQDSPNSQSQLTLSSLDDEQRQLLENHYPRTGYWFNMLPTHPFIHGSGSQATASGEAQSHAPVPQRLHDVSPFISILALSLISCTFAPYNTDSSYILHRMIHPHVQPPHIHSLRLCVETPQYCLDSTELAFLSLEIALSTASDLSISTQQRLAAVNSTLSTSDTNITVSVPMNTGVPRGQVSCVQLRLPVDIGFEDFFSRVCAKMDLNPSEAQLGYKFNTDHVRDDPNQLSSEMQLQIFNLQKAQAAGHRSREEADLKNQEPPTSISFAAEFHELKNHLSCAKHTGKHCYVNPITGDHEALDIYRLTLWAKKISLGETTYEKPPKATMFDHVPKKRRTSSTSASSTPIEAGSLNMPAIHIHVPSEREQPLNGFQRHVNSTSFALSTSLISDDVDRVIEYPPIIDVLQEMDQTMPLLNMPQYEAALIEHGIAYVNAVVGISDQLFVDVIGMPIGVIRSFFNVVCRLIKHANKGKGWAKKHDIDADKENDEQYHLRMQNEEL
ncbi:hypothetical protein EDD22DRAFT_947961 [Suillus occidentalis]|nr:hypothetical protein EDD22DRAFT_947961 [Suillus occidentalis]